MRFKSAFLKFAVFSVQLIVVLTQLAPIQPTYAETEEEEEPSRLIFNGCYGTNQYMPTSSLTKHHPRLLLTEVRLRRIHKYIETNALAGFEYNVLKKRGDEILQEAPVKYTTTGDLLEVSRTALKRIYVLGMLYQLSRESKWSKRAREEMLSAAAFPSWHPDHFLDTAEMTHAMSIGYDWCFDALDSNDRKTIANAIFELGLKPGLEAFYTKKYFWVDEPHSNWNIVCCGGLLMGALALIEEFDKLRNDQVHTVAQACILRMHKFTTWEDGDWCEGPSYWNYGTIYAVTGMDALETSLGTDFNISDREGFRRAGDFFLDLIGPTQQTFNFADASPEIRNSPQLFWFARRYKLPYLAYEERYLIENASFKLDPRDLIWFSNKGTKSDFDSRPLKNEYSGITQLVSMRSERGVDPKHDDALFVAVKGGDNRTHHSHLELGTFVFDASGCRWVSQLGMENYDLPGQAQS
jgi:hypothetical protein